MNNMSKFESYFFEKFGNPQSTNSEDRIQKLVQDTQLEQEAIESLVALINKTVIDWNRDKKLDGKEIEKLIVLAIKEKAIQIE
jgi:hypothetical protein